MVAVLVSFGMVGQAWANGNIKGHAARIEKIKGTPAAGYIEVYENNLFLSPPNSQRVGPSRRLGTTCHNGVICQMSIITGDGCYCIDGMPGGAYSILVNQPDFFVRPIVLPNIQVVNNQTIEVNVNMPIDFSTYFKQDQQWTGSEPTWYQTYTATGTSVTGVTFVLAGTGATMADVAILEDNGNTDVRQWTLVPSPNGSNPTVVGANPQREWTIKANTDNWVRWRSGEVPTTPGKRYAVRIAGADGNIQPYKRDKDGMSYAGGRAYNSSGQAQNYDLNYIVFADNDGTRITMCDRTLGIGQLRDGNFTTAWGQTFVAKGYSLAGVDCWAAGANRRWDLDFLWRIREGGPTGPFIGPSKITAGAFFSFGVGLHGVSYNPGEVMLQPNQTYFVQIDISNPPADSNGFNPLISDDPYGGGSAYRFNGLVFEEQAADDLNMTIVEYTPTTPIIQLNTTQIERNTDKGVNLPNDTFTIRNNGIGVLNYAISDNAAWLSISPPNGQSTGEVDSITIQYAVAGLAKGTYTAEITVTDPTAANSPQKLTVKVNVKTVGPDFDGDADVDQQDFGHLQTCYSGPGVTVTDPACFDAQLDGDDDVDLDDFGVFQACYSGPNKQANFACDD